MFASGSIESISRLHLDTASINGFVSDAIWMETARATTPALTDYCPHIFHAFHPLQTLVQTPGSTHNSHLILISKSFKAGGPPVCSRPLAHHSRGLFLCVEAVAQIERDATAILLAAW